MSIQEVFRKFKAFWSNTDMLLAMIIIVTALLSFMLGRYSVTNVQKFTSETRSASPHNTDQIKEQVLNIQESVTSGSNTASNERILAEGKYVASKSGTKYHLPWCGGAQQIKEENKIWFNTKEDAEKAGYTPASNCKGI